MHDTRIMSAAEYVGGLRGRLRHAIEQAGGFGVVAKKMGVARQTLYNLAGPGATGPISTARIQAIAEHTGRDVHSLLTAGGVASRIPVPVLDIEVAAGDGRSLAEGLANGQTGDARPFDEEWLRQSFGNPATLRLLTVRGDSQAPLLEDGDEIMVDVGKTNRSDGMAVVLFGEQLMVKRLQFAGPIVQLSSSNPIYPPVTIDLRDESADFKIVAKVVWRSGKMR